MTIEINNPSSIAATSRNAAPPASWAKSLEALVSVTQELFPGDVSIEVSCDPEWPADKYVVVFANPTSEGGMARRLEWHERVRGLCGHGEDVRLSFAK